MQEMLFTIGYSAFERDMFLTILKELGVACLVDVRSVPASKMFPQYNREVLSKALNESGIKYRHYPEFGARQYDESLYTSKGYLDFDEYRQTEAFQNGVIKIRKGIEMGYRFVLMCAEKDPLNCHRAIMVSRGFKEQGEHVAHIRPSEDGGFFLERHEDLESRLVEKMGDNLSQLSFLETNEDRIAKAYRKQNAVIGYHLEEEQ